MERNFKKILKGYLEFRKKYAQGDSSVMHYLSEHGQQPKIMVVACCDSRVDPALILQCDPGDLFVVRNVASIIPPYEKDGSHHGTSAALEFAITVLGVKNLIILGHSQCGGMHELLHQEDTPDNDFITNWVSIIKLDRNKVRTVDDCARAALEQSRKNCMAFPWINKRVAQKKLEIHLWFFDIKTGVMSTYCDERKMYEPLELHKYS
jgi:carbonic anhydrase